MSHEIPGGETTFGYLSTLRSPEHGYFGGYLLLCSHGRPLEFHCTTPVQPSRAQEILYGPTLQPYLLGEQIGGTLLAVAGRTPRLILTDQTAMLAVRTRIEIPMVHVLARDEHDRETRGASTAQGMPILPQSPYQPLSIADYDVRLPIGFEADRGTVMELLGLLSQHVDLAEPFGRIHEAIREAQRIGGRATESYGHAA